MRKRGEGPRHSRACKNNCAQGAQRKHLEHAGEQAGPFGFGKKAATCRKATVEAKPTARGGKRKATAGQESRRT
eukprot:5372420-Alexandrium_andersonii.AAC.1